MWKAVKNSQQNGVNLNHVLNSLISEMAPDGVLTFCSTSIDIMDF